MRITFVLAGANLAGGTRVVVLLAEHLRRLHHDVLLAFPAFVPPRPRVRDRVKSLLRLHSPPLYEENLSYFSLPGVSVPYRRIERMNDLIDGDLPDADVVVATFWTTAEWVSRLSPSKGRKVYFIQQFESNFGFPPERVEATWRLPIRKIVCSQWLADLAREKFDDAHVAVVENGVDPELFFAPPRRKQSVPTVGLLYAPYLPVKGTATALAVVNAASRHVPGLRVRAFGTVPIDSALPLPPGSEYVRQPPQDSLRSIYAGCDVWLCTSTSEGFHLPPHEAMACRCPVVSTRVGGPTDLIQQGSNGFLAEVGDIEGLTRYLIEVLRSGEDRWQSFSASALATALRYTWSEAAHKFEQAIAPIDQPSQQPETGAR